MKKFIIITDKEAKKDIQEAINYYNKINPYLGKRFKMDFKKSFQSIQAAPSFQIRYKDIHCLPLEVYPFMIHYSIDEKINTVFIHAVISTYMNPTTKWL
jgi:hypothetical protein